ncbi:MAG: PAS domain S-box protein [Nevskiaceae bacterium]|nr:MAG: PAS domain S-box protein [Nevskiaceae bacterium]TBR72745.1 MAG: PAS domain S-box protein [Nevskiaceae bacterium]
MAQAVDLAALVANAGDGIIVADTGENILYWNAAATRIFGFTPEEALGVKLSIIIPERFRTRHSTGFHHTMETGITRYGAQVLRVPALHKDGRKLSIAFTVTLLFDAAHKVTAIAAIVRDETERWQEEHALRARLKELEAH